MPRMPKLVQIQVTNIHAPGDIWAKKEGGRVAQLLIDRAHRAVPSDDHIGTLLFVVGLVIGIFIGCNL